MGAELLKERSWEGYLQQYGGNIDHVYSNGASTQVIVRLPDGDRRRQAERARRADLHARRSIT